MNTLAMQCLMFDLALFEKKGNNELPCLLFYIVNVVQILQPPGHLYNLLNGHS